MFLLALLKSTARVTCFRLSDFSYKTIVFCVTVFYVVCAILSANYKHTLDVSCCHHLLHKTSNCILVTTCLFLFFIFYFYFYFYLNQLSINFLHISCLLSIRLYFHIFSFLFYLKFYFLLYIIFFPPCWKWAVWRMKINCATAECIRRLFVITEWPILFKM